MRKLIHLLRNVRFLLLRLMVDLLYFSRDIKNLLCGTTPANGNTEAQIAIMLTMRTSDHARRAEEHI